MREKKEALEVQIPLVRWFSENYPLHSQRLVCINNDITGGSREYQYRLAMGLRAGAPDLVLFDDICLFIECKAAGSRHDIDSLRRQIRFAQNVEEKGHRYIMSSCLETLKLCLYNAVENGVLAIPFAYFKKSQDLRFHIINSSAKTVVI